MRSPAPLAPFLFLLIAALPGCDALGPIVAVNGVSLMLTERAVPDLLVSGVSGRDCSIAYLDAGERYCRVEPEPVAAPRCTRSLGSVDCWVGPVPGNPPPRDVGDARPAAPVEPWAERVL
jgi:hypothetical protein